MKLSEVPKGIRDMLSTFEALRRFGFEPNEIEYHIGTDAGLGIEVLYVLLKSRDKTCTIGVCPLFCEPAQAQSWFDIACDIWCNEATDEELYANFIETFNSEKLAGLGRAIQNAGILIPGLEQWKKDKLAS